MCDRRRGCARAARRGRARAMGFATADGGRLRSRTWAGEVCGHVVLPVPTKRPRASTSVPSLPGREPTAPSTRMWPTYSWVLPRSRSSSAARTTRCRWRSGRWPCGRRGASLATSSQKLASCSRRRYGMRPWPEVAIESERCPWPGGPAARSAARVQARPRRSRKSSSGSAIMGADGEGIVERGSPLVGLPLLARGGPTARDRRIEVEG
jgi:hypothetical protein